MTNSSAIFISKEQNTMSHLIDFHLLNDMKNIIKKVENLHFNNRNNQYFHIINHIKIHTSTYSGNQHGIKQNVSQFVKH